MANDVVFRFLAVDKFKPVADRIGRGIDKITRKAGNLCKKNKKVKKSFDDIGKAGKNAFGNLTAAVGAYFGLSKAVEVATSFEDAIADLSAITGLAGDELSYLTDETLRLAKAGAVGQNEVAAAFKGIASAKSELLSDPKGLSRVTEQVILLSNTGVDLATATDTVTKSLNQFNAGADKAAEYVDILAKGAQIGASEVMDTGEAVEKAGAVAASVGVKFSGLNAAIQVLAKGGVKGSEAGTMLKTVLLNLSTQDIPTLNPKVVGLTKAFENLSEAGLDTAQMKKLFGNEAIVAGEILSKNNKLLSRWAEEIKGVGSAQSQADIRLNTFNARMRRMGVTLSSKIIGLFSRLEPLITKNANAFGKWIDNISPKQVDSFASALKILIAGLSTVAKIIGGILKAMREVGKTIGQIAGAVSTLDFGHFDLGGPQMMPDGRSLSQAFFDSYKAPRSEAAEAKVTMEVIDKGGNVGSIKTQQSSSKGRLKVGTNMISG